MASIWHLWLWHRPAAAALIRLLAWEPPDAVSVAPKDRGKKKKEEEEEERKEGRKERKKQIEKEHEKDYQI